MKNSVIRYKSGRIVVIDGANVPCEILAKKKKKKVKK